jgi:3-oxoacyl-(acyl-carrier-protein) synthase
MTTINQTILELVKNKQISRDAARIMLDAAEKLQETTAAPESDRRIAIIGIAAELPGARTFNEFWGVLMRGEDRISDLPVDRQALCDPFVHANAQILGIDVDKPYWKAAWIADVDKFDPAFFGITPAEARVMDPQQRRFLQVAYSCFEDAGYAGLRIRGSKTGMYISAAMVNYVDVLDELTPQSVPGNVPAFVGSRMSYIFDLHGVSYVTSATCASSLLAVHEASLGLLNDDCEMALVGGVNIFPYPINDKKIFMNASGIMSEEERCRPFDQAASGIGRGEGVVALLLKPLTRALEDHDHIHGVILSSAVNNDGTSAGITAPNPRAHTELLLEAWRRAGISPETIAYFEAHGTGTLLGDPIEIRGITDAVRKYTDRRQFIALGSVKGNIGHLLDGVAGLSGLVKALHVLNHGLVPPTKYFDEPNRNIDFLDSPVFVPSVPWDIRAGRGGDQPLRVAVSCLGFNGTNVHLLLEESPAIQRNEQPPPAELLTFPFSARTPQSLQSLMRRYADSSELLAGLNPDDIAYTLWSGREHFEQRVAILASDTQGLLQSCRELALTPMETWVCSDTIVVRRDGIFSTEAAGSLALELAAAYTAGESCPWHRFFEGRINTKVSLPTYVFDERSLWVRDGEASLVTDQPNLKTDLDKVLSIAQTVLEVGELNASDNFFSCGGNSLSGMQFIGRLKKELKSDMRIADLFALPDFQHIAERVSESTAPSYTAIPQVPKADDYLVSYAQRRLWIIEQLADEKTAYNVPFMFELNGPLDKAVLKQTFDLLSYRHEALRTTFVYHDDELRQRIGDAPCYNFIFEDLTDQKDAETVALREIERWKKTAYHLDTGPLLRVNVYQVSPTRTLLSLMLHHLITDGWSLAVLSNELLQFYNSCYKGTPANLPPITTRYIDYCDWQRQRLADSSLKKQEDYWLRSLSDDLPVTEIPGDRPRPAIFRFTGDIRRFELRPDLIDALRQLAQQQGATLYMVLVASVVALIQRMTGDTDIVLGTPISGRIHADLEPLIGMLTNTLALRVRADPEEPFISLLEKVKQTVLGAYENQDYPFDLLVDKLNIGRDTSHSPIFNINVALQNFRGDNSIDQTFAGAIPHQLQTEHHTSKWDLEFEFVELQNGELSCNLEYYSGIYSDHAIESLVETYLRLLSQIISLTDRQRSLATLSVQSEEMRAKMLRQGHGASVPHSDGHLGYLVRILEQGKTRPDDIAVIDPAGTIKYGDLLRTSSMLAKHIQEMIGDETQPTILLLLENNRHVYTSILGSLLAGATFVPVTPNTPRRRIQAIIKASQARLIFTQQSPIGWRMNHLPLKVC